MYLCVWYLLFSLSDIEPSMFPVVHPWVHFHFSHLYPTNLTCFFCWVLTTCFIPSCLFSIGDIYWGIIVLFPPPLPQYQSLLFWDVYFWEQVSLLPLALMWLSCSDHSVGLASFLLHSILYFVFPLVGISLDFMVFHGNQLWDGLVYQDFLDCRAWPCFLFWEGSVLVLVVSVLPGDQAHSGLPIHVLFPSQGWRMLLSQ